MEYSEPSSILRTKLTAIRASFGQRGSGGLRPYPMRSLCPSIIIASASEIRKCGWLEIEWLLRFLSCRNRRHPHIKTTWSIDMELEIAGKSAIVCASSAGLGMGCAKALAKEGVNVII